MLESGGGCGCAPAMVKDGDDCTCVAGFIQRGEAGCHGKTSQGSRTDAYGCNVDISKLSQLSFSDFGVVTVSS